MTLVLYILGIWAALAIICAPFLVPMLARRFALAEDDRFTMPLRPLRRHQH